MGEVEVVIEVDSFLRKYVLKRTVSVSVKYFPTPPSSRLC